MLRTTHNQATRAQDPAGDWGQNVCLFVKSDGEKNAGSAADRSCRTGRSYSTVTLFARFRGWSTFDPRFTAT